MSVRFEKDDTLKNLTTNDVDHCQIDNYMGFYEKLTDLHYQTSPPFKNVQDVRTGCSEGFASIRIPSTSKHMTKGYELSQMLHPATLDRFTDDLVFRLRRLLAIESEEVSPS